MFGSGFGQRKSSQQNDASLEEPGVVRDGGQEPGDIRCPRVAFHKEVAGPRLAGAGLDGMEQGVGSNGSDVGKQLDAVVVEQLDIVQFAAGQQPGPDHVLDDLVVVKIAEASSERLEQA